MRLSVLHEEALEGVVGISLVVCFTLLGEMAIGGGGICIYNDAMR